MRVTFSRWIDDGAGACDVDAARSGRTSPDPEAEPGPYPGAGPDSSSRNTRRSSFPVGE